MARSTCRMNAVVFSDVRLCSPFLDEANLVTATAREQHSVRTLLDSLKKTVPFQSGLVLSVVPRGGLQIAQPSNVPDALLKSYAKGSDTEDRLSWQAVIKRKPY